MSSDEAIQLTNNDASNFKAYAVSRGYWNDPYINFFSSKPGLRDSQSNKQVIVEHKPPEMSRGYFARVNAIRSVVDKFLNKFNKDKCQIINIGAGFDTLYFNLIDQNKLPTRYVEVDFSRIVTSKIRLIKTKKILSDKIIKSNKLEVDIKSSEQSSSTSLSQSSDFKVPSLFLNPANSFVHPCLQSNNEINTDNYNLVSADLRNVKDLDKKLKDCKLDFSLPTLVLAECVLVYMTSESSNDLLKYFSEHFSKCCFVNYEQVNLNDKFGEIMLANMEARACKLLGTTPCNSIDTQFNRFVRNGFDQNTCQIITMTDFYKNKLDKLERNRIESIEFLDESELLFQLMDHYCVCIAANYSDFKELFYN